MNFMSSSSDTVKSHIHETEDDFLCYLTWLDSGNGVFAPRSSLMTAKIPRVSAHQWLGRLLLDERKRVSAVILAVSHGYLRLLKTTRFSVLQRKEENQCACAHCYF